MGPRRRDPFERVDLDDNFVRNARFVEPSAAERTREVAPAGRSPHAWVRGALGRPPGVRRVVGRVTRRARWHHRRLARTLALVILLLGIATAGVLILIRQGVSRPGPAGRVADPSARPGAGRSTAMATALALAPAPPFAIDPVLDSVLKAGMCLTWSRVDGRPTSVQVADCRDLHRDEITRVLPLRPPQYRSWPGDSVLARLAASTCPGALTVYGIHPASGSGSSGPALVAGAVYPDAPSWQAGARQLACTVRAADGSLRQGSARAAGGLSSATPASGGSSASGGTSASGGSSAGAPVSAAPSLSRPPVG